MKKIIILILSITIVLGAAFIVYKLINKEEKQDELLIIKEEKSKFKEYAITNKVSNIYEIKENSYKLIGSVNKGIELKIENANAEYFKINGLNYYIDYRDLESIDIMSEKNYRYKDYIVFNNNIETNNITKLYDQDGNLVYSFNKSYEFPIIIKEIDKYGIEFNKELLYIKSEDVKRTYENKNTEEATRENIRTLTYHTVYDPNTQKCTSIEICHTISQFESHMKYLSENKFLTLTLDEVEMFLDKKIRIPKNTIAITLDDGIFLENSIPLVEKYGVYATFFIITSKVDVSSHFDSKYARFESHTDDLHNNYKCPLNSASSQGGQMLCEKKENIVADLKLSQEKLGESYYFAYPFFDFNDNAKSALIEANFRMAFIGQWNTDGYSDPTTDRLMLRRKTVFGNLSMDGFIDYLK